MRKGRLLIVDDEEDIRAILRATLFRYVGEIEEACDGEDASQKLKAQHFDLVISDVNMPRKSGLQLLKWIQEEKISTNVIMVSGYGDSGMMAEAKKYGAVDFLNKPWDRTEIVTAVQKIVAKIP